MSRRIHYEAAFEDYLRSRGLPYVPVDEQRQAIFAGSKIKSFDFIVYPPSGGGWLVDVKGRKFPYHGSSGNKRYWENWVTQNDLDGLERWQEAFGEGFQALLVFAYWLTGEGDKLPSAHVHTFKEHYYSFFSIPVSDYRKHCRPRSAKWGTVAMPVKKFRELASPLPVIQTGEG